MSPPPSSSLKRLPAKTVPLWPGEAWHEAWHRTLGVAWEPGVTPWHTLCRMANTLHALRGKVESSNTENSDALYNASHLFESWALGQEPPRAVDIPSLEAQLGASGEACVYAFRLPAVGAYAMDWCKALNQATPPPPLRHTFFPKLLAFLSVYDRFFYQKEGGYKLTRPIKDVLALWCACTPKDQDITAFLKDNSHPAIIYALTRTHPHLITAPTLEGSGIYVRPKRFERSILSWYPWSDEDRTAYIHLLEQLPVSSRKYLHTARLRRSLPKTWCALSLAHLPCHHHQDASSLSLLHLYSALAHKPLTPPRLDRAFAWCFALKKKTDNPDALASAFAFADVLWKDRLPQEISRRTVHYITAQLQHCEKALRTHLAVPQLALLQKPMFSTLCEKLLGDVACWQRQILTLQLHHEMTDALVSPLFPSPRKRL